VGLGIWPRFVVAVTPERSVTRANLLPRPTVTWTVFGVTLERATVAEALLGAFVIALAGGATVTFEALQVAGAHAQATQLEGLVATHAARRHEAATLGVEVARLQQLGAESARRRGSGNDVARALASIGNAIPAADWLDSIERHPEGYIVSGGSPSLDDVGPLLTSVERAARTYRTSLIRVVRDDRGTAVHFSLQLLSPAAMSPAAAPIRR
jgi:hypothetical protein